MTCSHAPPHDDGQRRLAERFAQVDQECARLAARDGWVVLHDLAVPGNQATLTTW
jgi:hypothetical protein